MWEVELQIVQVKVDNVVKLRLQGYSRFGRITCTRILNLNLIQSVVSNDCNCFSTKTTATFNDNARSRGITSTRICDLDLGQNGGVEQLKVNRECNLWFQCIVMGITITKFVVLKFFDLTNVLTCQEHGCSTTFRRNDNLQICTRTSQLGSKNTLDRINIDATCSVSLARISNNDASNSTRTNFLIYCNSDAAKTTFTITKDGHLIICTDSILRTTRYDINTLNLTERCNVRDDGQLLIESTLRDQFDTRNRSDCTLRSRGICGVRNVLIIFAHICICELRFTIKGELEDGVAFNFINNICSIKRSLLNIHK